MRHFNRTNFLLYGPIFRCRHQSQETANASSDRVQKPRLYVAFVCETLVSLLKHASSLLSLVPAFALSDLLSVREPSTDCAQQIQEMQRLLDENVC